MLRDNKTYILVLLFGLILFIPGLGRVHLFDWDEINFAESAREMIVTGDYSRVMVDYSPFWEKPPLFFWLQTLSMKLFGINEFAARLPNALIGVITLLFIFFIGRNHHGTRFAWFWVLLYTASITPQLYFHSGIIDPLFNLFIFTSIWSLYKSQSHTGVLFWLISGLAMGLAVLTKGPVGALVIILVLGVMFIRKHGKLWTSWSHVVVWALSGLLIASFWFLPELVRNGPGFLKNFIAYQWDLFRNPVASHGQPWFYHPVVLLIGCFPASILFLPILTSKLPEDGEFLQWMKFMFWVVLILFSIVTTKIVHYSSLCYLPLTFMAAQYLWAGKRKKGVLFGLSILTVLIAGLLFALVYVGRNSTELAEKLSSTIKDPFVLESLAIDGGWVRSDYASSVLLFAISVLVMMMWWWGRQRSLLYSLAVQSGIVAMTFYVLTPNIERHSQGSAIAFLESIKGDDAYVDVFGFKSYAHYFYTKALPLSPNDGLYKRKKELLEARKVKSITDLNEAGRKSVNDELTNWMIYGKIDKPVYLLCKLKKVPFLESREGMTMVMNSGGYAAFRRDPEEK